MISSIPSDTLTIFQHNDIPTERYSSDTAAALQRYASNRMAEKAAQNGMNKREGRDAQKKSTDESNQANQRNRRNLRKDETDFQPEFDRDARERLANRCFEKRDLILIMIENYIINTGNSQSHQMLNTIDVGCNNVIEKPILQLMSTHRQLRAQWKGQIRPDEMKGRERLAKNLNVSQLNSLLHYLDNLYRDISELIQMNTTVNLLAQQPVRNTIDQLLMVFRTLLTMNGASPR